MKLTVNDSISARVQGLVGRGVQSARLGAEGQLILIMTDGAQLELGCVTGPQGPKGDTGARGEAGTAAPVITDLTVQENGHLRVTLSNGSCYDAGVCRGD